MLTQKTAAALHNCHQQIINAHKLLEGVEKAVERDPTELRDSFGRSVHTLQLGVPGGHSSHTIFNVDFDLAEIIIKAQIEKYKSQLAALNELALVECKGSGIADGAQKTTNE